MTRSHLIAATLVALAFAGTHAAAQTPRARQPVTKVAPAKRLQAQALRIHRGVTSGRIDRVERLRLLRGETTIRQKIRALRQRGQPPTLGERRALNRSLLRMNRAIRRAIRRHGGGATGG